MRYDHDAAAMHRKMAEMVLRVEGSIENLWPGRLQSQRLRYPAQPLIVGRSAGKSQHRVLPQNSRGDCRNFFGRYPVDFCCFPDGSTKAEAVLVRYHRCLAVVLLKDPFQNLIAFIPGKIDVDIGRVFAASV